MAKNKVGHVFNVPVMRTLKTCSTTDSVSRCVSHRLLLRPEAVPHFRAMLKRGITCSRKEHAMMKVTRFPLLMSVAVWALAPSAFAANGPKPGQSSHMPAYNVTTENQQLFSTARGRFLEISQRADADANERWEKLQAELLNSLRTRSKKVSVPAAAPCENCAPEAPTATLRKVSSASKLEPCVDCDVPSASVALEPNPDSLLAQIGPLSSDPAPLTDGALTFDELLADDLPTDMADVTVEEANDEEACDSPAETEPSVEVPAQPRSFNAVRADLDRSIIGFVKAMKLFGFWPEAIPSTSRAEFRQELVALEKEVGSLQIRIEALKRLTDEK